MTNPIYNLSKKPGTLDPNPNAPPPPALSGGMQMRKPRQHMGWGLGFWGL